MGLITVYFRKPGSYRKAIIDEIEVEFFLNLGAVRTFDELSAPVEPIQIGPETMPDDDIEDEPEPLLPEPNPDAGFGVPGSIEFHQNAIMSMESVKDINDYLLIVTEIGLDNRIKKLSKAKAAAIEAVKEWMRDGSQNV